MGSNPGTDAAASTARSSADLQKALSDIALPALRDVLTYSMRDLGQPGTEPDSVSKAFGDARTSIQGNYDNSNARGTAAIKQQALQSGMNYNGAAVNSTISQFGSQLEQGRATSLRALNFQESQAGLNQTNQLLSQINSGAGGILGGSLRFGQNALGSDQLLSQLYQQNQSNGATYGAIGGTIIGAALSPYTGGLSIPIGSAVGGAVGGYIGGQ